MCALRMRLLGESSVGWSTSEKHYTYLVVFVTGLLSWLASLCGPLG